MATNGYIGNTAEGVKSIKEAALVSVDVYLSGGGGSGGCCDWGGGGGGGGVLYSTSTNITFQKGIAYTVTVGGGNGGHSYVADMKADGGGGGAPKYADKGGNGGCGGGGPADKNYGQGGDATQDTRYQYTYSKGILKLQDFIEKTSSPGYGQNGGGGNQGGQRASGGGGSTNVGGGNGGSGKGVNWDATYRTYSGGGGPAGRFGGPGSGANGGGSGGNYGQNGNSAGSNRGSGGGGQGYTGSNAGSGGSGIVYIRSKSPFTKTGSSSSGSYDGYYWARWTGSGTVTF